MDPLVEFFIEESEGLEYTNIGLTFGPPEQRDYVILGAMADSEVDPILLSAIKGLVESACLLVTGGYDDRSGR